MAVGQCAPLHHRRIHPGNLIRVERSIGVQVVIETLVDVIDARCGPHSFGQRLGVYCQGAASMAGNGGRSNALHRTGQSLGEAGLMQFERAYSPRLVQVNRDNLCEFLTSNSHNGSKQGLEAALSHIV